MASQLLGIKSKFTNDLGSPLVGGQIYTFYAGTSTPQDTYSNAELTVPNTNPIRLDDTGSADIFLKGAYRIRVFDASGRFIEEQDSVIQAASAIDVAENMFTKSEANELKAEINEDIKKLGDGLESVSDLLLIANPTNGMTVKTKSYHTGENKGGNTYRYNATRAAENDGGSIINGWEVLDKNVLTVWDFGYKIGDETASKKALKDAVESKVPLQFLDETLTAHGATGNVNCEINGHNKTVFGAGRTRSIIPKLKIKAQNGSFIFRGFRAQDLGLNVGITIQYYDQVLIDDFDCDVCYDGVLVWRALDVTKSKAIVQNSYASRAGRIGFTADVDVANIKFINCHTDLSYQGFHVEKCLTDIEYINCTASRCGQTPSGVTHATDQPLAYAGGFMASSTPHKIKYTNCKNINKVSGSNRDYIVNDIGSYELYGCEGFSTYMEENQGKLVNDIAIIDSKDGSILNGATAHVFKGKLTLKNLESYGDIELNSASNTDDDHGFAEINITNVECGRIQLAGDKNTTLNIDNLRSSGRYWNAIRRFKHAQIGYLEFTQTQPQADIFPNYGFRFYGQDAETFYLNEFRTNNGGSGRRIQLENLDESKFKVGYVGILSSSNAVYTHFDGLDFDKFNITVLGRAATKATTATTSQLTSKAHVINTSGKYLGREVYNTTDSKFVKAVGSSSTSNWVYADATAAITPA